jgi:hypothetical protein
MPWSCRRRPACGGFANIDLTADAMIPAAVNSIEAPRPRCISWRAGAVILLLGSAIFFVHKLPYLLIYVQECGRHGRHFCMATAKGDQGYTFDLANFAKQIRSVHDNGVALFRPDPYHYENAGKTFPEGMLVYTLCSLPMLFTDRVEASFLLAPLFSIMLCTLLLYCAAGLWGRRDLSGAGHFSMFLLSLSLVWLCGGWPAQVTNLARNALGRVSLPRDLDYVGRFPHVEFTLLVLVAWYAALLKVMDDGKTLSALLLGLALAAAQYSYFYYWTACATTTFFALVVLARPKNALRIYAVTSAVYLLLSMPMLLRFHAFQQSDFGREYALRIGAETGLRQFVVSRAGAAIALALFLIDLWHVTVFVGKRPFSRVLLATVKASAIQLSVFAAYTVCTNVHLLVGKTVEPYHWDATFYTPMLGILSFPYLACLGELSKHFLSHRLNKWLPPVLTAGAILIAVLAVGNQIRFAKAWAPYFTTTDNEQAILDYVRATGLRGVLWSNNTNVNLLVGANTRLSLLLGNAFSAYNTDQECLERLVYGFYRMGYGPHRTLAELRKGQLWIEYLNAVRAGRGKSYFLDSNGSLDNYGILIVVGHRKYLNEHGNAEQGHVAYTVPESMAESIQQMYQTFSQAGTPPFRLDYLLYDRRILPPGDRSWANGGEVLLENPSFVLTRAR